MKIHKINKEFTPIEVSITIETKEEFDIISDICAYNESIPELIRPGDELAQNKVRDFLNILRITIRSEDLL